VDDRHTCHLHRCAVQVQFPCPSGVFTRDLGSVMSEQSCDWDRGITRQVLEVNKSVDEGFQADEFLAEDR